MKNLIIAGAAPNTGNLGVSALCDALVNNLPPLSIENKINILDFSNGVREDEYALDDGHYANLVGANHSKRFYKESSFINIFAQWRSGLVMTPTAQTFSNSIVLDVSGGDSFTDLYGDHRFKLTSYPKELAIKSSSGLILMPQTIGPFYKNNTAKKAIEYIEYSDLVYTRDADSYLYLQELLGDKFDPDKHKQGVDMAFLLSMDKNFGAEFLEGLSGNEIVGVNVSGLIYNNKSEAVNRYGIKCDYNKVIKSIIEEILNTSDSSVLLIPHVLVPETSDESDYAASVKLRNTLSPEHQHRVRVLSGDYNQKQVKSVIANCNWFCGMRMHATIAGLSSSVPTVNIAYSGKSKGVFASVGQENSVLDARQLNDEQLFSQAIELWSKRDEIRQELEREIGIVKANAANQMKEIASVIEAR